MVLNKVESFTIIDFVCLSKYWVKNKMNIFGLSFILSRVYCRSDSTSKTNSSCCHKSHA